jgi:hypothetical protein
MFDVAVVDANGLPVADALVNGPGAEQVRTGADGRAVLQANPAGPLTVAVAHARYVTESVSLGSLDPNAVSDNPLATPRGFGLTLRLGRMAPTLAVEKPEAELKQLAAKGADAGAPLLFHPPRFPRLRAYNAHWNDERDVHVARATLLPDGPHAGRPAGWRRFKSDVRRVDVAALGRFFYLAWGDRPAAPEQLVAVYSPNLANETPLDALDFVVFFSPGTWKFVPRFPYGLDRGVGVKQPYLDLGVKYLVNEYFYVLQLLAHRNRAAVVMPICKRGQYGPVAFGEGLLRLLREVALFLHREGRTSRLGNASLSTRPDLLGGASARDQLGAVRGTRLGAVPSVGRVAVAGFSSGMGPVKQLLTRWDVDAGRPLWGIPPVPGSRAPAPQELWRRAFREVWDLDGAHAPTGGWPSFLQALLAWYRADRERGVRLYHSEDTGTPDPKSDDAAIWRELRQRGVSVDREVPPTPGIGWATELGGPRWTVVRLANAYVSGGPESEGPHLSDAHHAVPKVGFSHAAGLTEVGRAAGP